MCGVAYVYTSLCVGLLRKYEVSHPALRATITGYEIVTDKLSELPLTMRGAVTAEMHLRQVCVRRQREGGAKLVRGTTQLVSLLASNDRVFSSSAEEKVHPN